MSDYERVTAIHCPRCGSRHILEDAIPKGRVQFFRCPKKGVDIYLATIDGALLGGIEPA